MFFDFSRSIVEEKILFNRPFLFKRDDLIHTYCNGNKARKFASLFKEDVYKTWVSYGGSQSNAMFALAYLAKLKGVVFKYVMPSLPIEPIGNLAYSLAWGMQAHVLPTGSDIKTLAYHAKSLVDCQTLFIPQGGLLSLALEGMSALALELKKSIGGKPILFYTSGSGIGVIALQKALDMFFPSATLIAISCAGTEAQLREKCRLFQVEDMNILCSPFAFAKPQIKIWEMRAYLQEHNIICDLLYDSSAFCVIQSYLNDFKQKDIVFIHSGGLMGDVSQEQRYKKLLSKI